MSSGNGSGLKNSDGRSRKSAEGLYSGDACVHK